MDLDRYAHLSDERVYEKFIAVQGKVSLEHDEIDVDLKKHRNLLFTDPGNYEDLQRPTKTSGMIF